jgi:cytochrome c biogenesis protein CcmG/thiol:disulfide interchange protein DsbE
MTPLPPPAAVPARRGVKWPFLVVGLAIVAALVALLASGFGHNPMEVPDERTGDMAPSFTLQDLDGKTWSLKELAGKPVVLNFWSTWCGPCKYEHPLLLAAARANPDVVFLGVVYSDDPDKARRYLAEQGAAYAHLVDPDGRVAIDYGVGGVPETFFVDTTGRIVQKIAAPLVPQVLGPLLDEIRGTTGR